MKHVSRHCTACARHEPYLLYSDCLSLCALDVSPCRKFSKSFDINSIDPSSMATFFTVGAYTAVNVASQLMSLLAWSKSQSLGTYIETSLAIQVGDDGNDAFVLSSI